MTNEEKLAEIRELRLIDDIFFEAFCESTKAVEEMLRVILEDDGLQVESVIPQSSIRNLYGRSVRLDALCILGNGSRCNIEIQRSDEDHERRARYNASMITVKDSEPGELFKDVKNVIVVYISENDIFKGNKTIYHVKKTLDETGETFEDGLTEIFVNTEVNDGSRIADLMACFMLPLFDNPDFPEVTAEVKKLKTTEGGLQTMCEFSQRLLAEGRAEGELKAYLRLVEQGVITKVRAAELLGVSQAEFEKRAEALEKDALAV
jgi:hypothetical protein